MKKMISSFVLVAGLMHGSTAWAQLDWLFGKTDHGKTTAASLDRQSEFAELAAFANFLLRAAAPVCAQPYFGMVSLADGSMGLISSFTHPNGDLESSSKAFLLQKFGPHPDGILVVAPPHRWLGLDAADLKSGDLVLHLTNEESREQLRSVQAEPASSLRARQMEFFHALPDMQFSVVRAGITRKVSLPAGTKCENFSIVAGEGHWADAERMKGVRATAPLLKKLSRVELAAVLAREIGLLMISPAPFETMSQPSGVAASQWNKEARMMGFSGVWRVLAADAYAINLLSHVGVTASEYSKAVARLDSSEFGSILDSSKYSITRPHPRMRIKFLEDASQAETAGQPLPSADDAAQQSPQAPIPGSVKWVSSGAIDAAFARPNIAKWLPEVREWLRKP